jgi:hypothetical protein
VEGEGLGVGCCAGGDGAVKSEESNEGQGVVVGMGESQGFAMELVEGQGGRGLARKSVGFGVNAMGKKRSSVELRLLKVVSDGDPST